ncbi:4-hydroxythreonine-4-phosphate dehydrogenase [Geothrix limicola]|uniref:4-hydroxythreonine-4-phosphate dehydrogenase n=1 Tax=Geothrix limicola TaxID=2927978 RepID=A0ABQ5QCQ2_9BACT|nr:4-hydroxythreonine-4-phosphate dehydrogenase PdxA [Geothrix limicola]GLH72241.1 4-hydroxythreonine-4-phosphate dehydrogenase [Geothrix limicola]
MSRRPHIVISLGDPCGIGPELLLAGLSSIRPWTDVTVVGCKGGVDLLLDRPGAPVAWRWVEPPIQPPGGFSGKAYGLQVLSLGETPGQILGEALWLDPTPEIGTADLTLGEGSAASGQATVEAIRVAALMALSGAADALVTLPMAKSAAHLAGYDIPGHTEYLQDLSGAPITRMAFVSPRLNVVLHTVHQSLRSVVETIDADEVAETLVFSADQFIRLTGKLDLRVALCALNPHAGEQGAFGGEEVLLEEAIVQAEAAFMDFPTAKGPASASVSPFRLTLPPSEVAPPQHSAGQRGLEVLATGDLPDTRPAPRFFGPLPSDSLFGRASRGEFDLVVALYHDQGLIPVKVLEPARAVNLTLGLPFIRTSPDHGTAFDKAGKWIADAQNFLEAAALAVRLSGRAGQLAHPNVPLA